MVRNVGLSSGPLRYAERARANSPLGMGNSPIYGNMSAIFERKHGRWAGSLRQISDCKYNDIIIIPLLEWLLHEWAERF